MAVERRQVLSQRTQVKEPIDASKQMIRRNVVIEFERVEELILIRCLPHHGLHLRQRLRHATHAAVPKNKKSFSTELG
jgi:hypothetical protein